MPMKVYTTVIASGASTSSFVMMPEGGYVQNVIVYTMSTGAQVNVFASADKGASFYQVYTGQSNTATVAAQSFCIATGVGSGGGMIPMPPGIECVQFRTTGVVSGGVIFKVIGLD